MPTPHPSGALQALYRVFVAPTLPAIRPIRGLPRQAQSPRAFSTTTPLRAKTRAPEIRAHKWNEEIRSPQIYLVGTTTNELTLRSREEVLSTLNKDTHRLVQVDEQPAPQDPFDHAAGRKEQPPVKPRMYPVCKILGKKAMYQQEKSRKSAQKEAKKASATASSVKTLELNWAIDGNDLGHRLERMKEFLAEGRKVEVVLAAKKSGRKASVEECRGVLGRIRGAVDMVQGAKEAKGLEGKVGGFCTVLFQGRVPVGQGQGQQGGGGVKGKQKEKIREASAG